MSHGWSVLGALLVVTCAASAPERGPPARASPARSTSVAQATPDGVALYAKHCSSCHGDEKKGRPAAATKKAIDEDTGDMGSLKFLTQAQLDAIAAAP